MPNQLTSVFRWLKSTSGRAITAIFLILGAVAACLAIASELHQSLALILVIVVISIVVLILLAAIVNLLGLVRTLLRAGRGNGELRRELDQAGVDLENCRAEGDKLRGELATTQADMSRASQALEAAQAATRQAKRELSEWQRILREAGDQEASRFDEAVELTYVIGVNSATDSGIKTYATTGRNDSGLVHWRTVFEKPAEVVEVTCLTAKTATPSLQYQDDTGRHWLMIWFIPPIKPGETRKWEVHHRCPGTWDALRQSGSDTALLTFKNPSNVLVRFRWEEGLGPYEI